MSVDQADKIDIATIDEASGDLWLTISDHLPWNEDQTRHLVLLQDKLNAYLRFIESGEVVEQLPIAEGRRVVINIVEKFPTSPSAEAFLNEARAAVEAAGHRLQFSLYRAD